MKRIALSIITLFVSIVCYGATFNQYWYVGDNTPIQTSCTTGGDIILPTPPTKYGYDFIGWEQAPLQRIEYLESTGTQYIDTGYYPNQDTRVVANVMILRNGGWIFGARTVVGASPLKNSFDANVNPSVSINNLRSDYNTQITWGNTTLDLYNKIITFDKNKNIATVTVNGFTISTMQSNPAIFTCDYTLTLFATNSDGSPIIDGSERFYYTKIYDNDVLVRDMIPVLDRNGTPCMCDKVEGKFYYNAGTGDFIAGPVIEE